MSTINVDNLRADYHKVVRHVRLNGDEVPSRDGDTREVLDALIVVKDPTDVLPTGIGRKLNPRIAAIEALSLIGGIQVPELLVRAAPNFSRFRDGEYFHGAYGPRISMQLPAVVRRLQRDPGTRQAVITIWDPLHDLMQEGRHDYPCTVMLQFLVRNGELQLHTTMRSNDVWLGLTYDAFMFTQLQLTVARALGLVAGPYYHHAVSLHIYERDVDASREIGSTKEPPAEDRPVGLPYSDIDINMALAKQLLHGDAMDSAPWYSRVLAPLFGDS